MPVRISHQLDVAVRVVLDLMTRVKVVTIRILGVGDDGDEVALPIKQHTVSARVASGVGMRPVTAVVEDGVLEHVGRVCLAYVGQVSHTYFVVSVLMRVLGAATTPDWGRIVVIIASQALVDSALQVIR